MSQDAHEEYVERVETWVAAEGGADSTQRARRRGLLDWGDYLQAAGLRWDEADIESHIEHLRDHAAQNDWSGGKTTRAVRAVRAFYADADVGADELEFVPEPVPEPPAADDMPDSSSPAEPGSGPRRPSNGDSERQRRLQRATVLRRALTEIVDRRRQSTDAPTRT